MTKGKPTQAELEAVSPEGLETLRHPIRAGVLCDCGAWIVQLETASILCGCGKLHPPNPGIPPEFPVRWVTGIGDEAGPASVATGPTALVLDHIAIERTRQDGIWGVQSHPDGTSTGETAKRARLIAQKVCQAKAARGEVTWLDIAREEWYEACAETDPRRLRTELVQLAAVLTNWVEDIDRKIQEDPDGYGFAA